MSTEEEDVLEVQLRYVDLEALLYMSTDEFVSCFSPELVEDLREFLKRKPIVLIEKLLQS